MTPPGSVTPTVVTPREWRAETAFFGEAPGFAQESVSPKEGLIKGFCKVFLDVFFLLVLIPLHFLGDSLGRCCERKAAFSLKGSS